MIVTGTDQRVAVQPRHTPDATSGGKDVEAVAIQPVPYHHCLVAGGTR